jgi:bla regulator protein blaR1
MNEYLGPMAMAVTNHLWQSTIGIAVAWLLTLMLRTNTARTRQRIWMAASLKFMLPFGLLVTAGSHMVQRRPAAQSASALYAAMNQWAQPAIALAVQQAPAELSAGAKRQSTAWHALPMMLTVVWLCGFVVVVGIWSLRWRSLIRIKRAAIQMPEGRETAALWRVQQRSGARRTIRMLRCEGEAGQRLEPGEMGVRSPVLLWPDGISERLSDAQIEAILAHELQHVKHRDNLMAMLHMVVEAVFWFHPLVWWMEARLVEERERACDEEVLRLGNEPAVYAQSILKTCEFCVESPLACMTGVTGAELKQRIVEIMSLRLGRELSLTKKVLLALAAALVVAGPVLFGLVYAPQVRAQGAKMPAFDVATIKPPAPDGRRMSGFYGSPGGRVFFGQNIKFLVQFAFNLQDFQITGAPDWVSSRWYEINAIPPDDSPSRQIKLRTAEPTPEQQLMLQSLLRDRFGLKYHFETKEGEVYILSRGNGKLQLKPTEHSILDPRAVVFGPLGGVDQLPKGNGAAAKDNGAVAVAPAQRGGPDHRITTPDGVTIAVQGYNTTTDYLALRMSGYLQRPVLNQTGISGSYDFDVPLADPENHDMAVTVLNLANDLGLKIKRSRGPVQTLVIDHIDLPTEN